MLLVNRPKPSGRIESLIAEKDDEMKVLMVYADPYPHIGGLSTHMELLGKGLQKMGIRVEYLSQSSLPKPVRMLLAKPVRVLNRLCKGLGSVYSLYLSTLVFSAVLLVKTHREKTDFIDAHHISSAISAGFAGKPRGVPVILTVHTYTAFELESAGLLVKNSAFERIVLRHEMKAYESADHIVTVDNRLKEYLLGLGIEREKIDVMFNPVDTEVFKPRSGESEYRRSYGIPEGKLVVLCPRRLARKNGVVYPVLAAKLLRQRIEDFVIVYAGDGEQRGEIERLVKESALEGKVLFLGFIDHVRMSLLYNAADIVVIPSISSEGLEEATSISALEAMSSGVPVIATRIGGLKDLITDGFNGILVDERNEKSLADAIYRLAKDRKLYDEIGANAVNYVRTNHSYESRAGFLMECFERTKSG